MLDYCLLINFFQKEISTYKILGNYTFHPGISNIISAKNITQSDNPDLVLIYNESYPFIDNFWRNELSDQVKFLIIIPKTEPEANRLYREIKAFGDHFFINGIILIKNIRPNFKDFYRAEILTFDNSTNTLDLFLETETYEEKLRCDKIFENEEMSMIKSIMSKSDYVYFGKKISNETLLKNQMISKLNFPIIEISDYGWFIKKDCVGNFWLLRHSKSKLLEDCLKFNQIKIKTPV